MLANMVEYMLPKILNDTILECKWEALKEVVFSSTNKCFSVKHMPYNDTYYKQCSSKKKLFDK